VSRSSQPATSTTVRTIWASLVPVAVVAAVGSYINALSVVQAADRHRLVAWFVAGLADPVILGSSANIRDAYNHGSRLPRWSMLSVGVAIVVTLGFNVAAAGVFTIPPWLVNVWLPVAFLMVLESLMSYTKRGRAALSPIPPGGGPATPSHCPHGVATTIDDAVWQAFAHARDCEGEPFTYVDLAARFGLDRKKVAAAVKAAQAGGRDASTEDGLFPGVPATASQNGDSHG
jgi:hypothetical protein